MPRHCSAAGCKSRDTRETRKAGITFHRLPKRGKPRRTLWILNSRRTGPQGKGQWDPQSHFIYFCSKHFTPESFELSGVSGYRRLKEDALPTVFETLPRPRRAASEKAQRGRSKQATTKRSTRKQARTLKPGKEEEKQEEQVSVPEGWVGADRPDTGSESAGREVKSEGARWEEDCKTEGGAGTQVETLPPAPSHLPSSLPHTSPMPPQILPPSPPALSTKPLPSPSPSPSETTSSSRPRPPSPPANPPSPSRYMRRLPPPPGFYLPREHNYAQLCPLVWRKRYERAIDTLEKSVRLLNAARRRENRLRHTLLRLRESRIRQNFRDGLRCGNEVVEGSGSAPSSWERRIHWQEVEENDMGRAEEDLRLIEDGLGEKGGWDRRAPPVRAALEEDAGFCFYCGRGWSEGEEEQEHQGGGSEDRYGKGKPRKLRKVTEEEVEDGQVERAESADTEECCFYYYCDDGEGDTRERDSGVQIVTLELGPPKPAAQRPVALAIPHEGPLSPSTCGAQTQAMPFLHTELPLRTPLQMTPTQLLQQGAAPPQQPRITDAEDGGAAAAIVQGGGEQRVFWVQEGAEGRLLLLPVPAEDSGGGGTAGKDGGPGESAFQQLVVSEVGFQKVPMMDEGEGSYSDPGGTGLRTVGQGEKEGGAHSDARIVGGSTDLRERLKEHLEGFQLQLSNEFTN